MCVYVYIFLTLYNWGYAMHPTRLLSGIHYLGGYPLLAASKESLQQLMVYPHCLQSWLQSNFQD